jgi:hypothetical protein
MEGHGMDIFALRQESVLGLYKHGNKHMCP